MIDYDKCYSWLAEVISSDNQEQWDSRFENALSDLTLLEKMFFYDVLYKFLDELVKRDS